MFLLAFSTTFRISLLFENFPEGLQGMYRDIYAGGVGGIEMDSQIVSCSKCTRVYFQSHQDEIVTRKANM